MKRKILSVLSVLMAVLMSTAVLSACNKAPAVFGAAKTAYRAQSRFLPNAERSANLGSPVLGKAN